MKLFYTLVISFFLFFNLAYAIDDFNFDVTEAEISGDGNIFKGLKGGTATSREGLVITAENFEYNKALNILNALGDVIIEDKINKQIIYADKITYLKDDEKIITKGKTKAIIESNYNFISSDVIFFREKMILISEKKSSVTDKNLNLYKLDNFEYSIQQKILKANNIIITTNYTKTKEHRDTYKFKSLFPTNIFTFIL